MASPFVMGALFWNVSLDLTNLLVRKVMGAGRKTRAPAG
jgi:hypothetical protein